MQMIMTVLRSLKGQGLAEYALILAFVALAAVIALNAMGVTLSAFFGNFVGQI